MGNKTKFEELIKRANENEDYDAMYEIGGMYKYGENGLQKDEKIAFEWYLKAAYKGHPRAMDIVGSYYERGYEFLEKNMKKAVEWYIKAIENGAEETAEHMAELYEYIRDEEYIRLSIEWYKESSKILSISNYRTGKIYEYIGRYDLAFSWYKETYNDNYIDDMLDEMVGNYSIELESKYKEIFDWYEAEAEQGNSKIYCAMGNLYMLRGNPKLALDWYQKAADDKNEDAMFAIGRMYENGEAGLQKDEAKALEYYLKASEKPEADTMYRVGECYEYGKLYYYSNTPFKQNIKSSLKWYKKAADKGNDNAIYKIVKAYENVEYDFEKDETKDL